ncbi:MAG TPA: hypothetical protein VMA37_05540 [Acetobacteraceae bacterium]|nr:hypothetical protein [Acetobacteraceae bacterium]
MRKALLTGTAALALGLFGYGVNSASAAPSINLNNIPVAVSTGSGTATSINKSGDGNAVLSGNHSDNGNGNGSLNGNGSHDGNGNGNGSLDDNLSHNDVGAAVGDRSAASGSGDANSGDINSHNSLAATGSGGGVAAAGDGTAVQLNGSADFVAPGGLLSNGTLAAVSSFNHTHVDITLATSHAGGSVDGGVHNDNGGLGFGSGSLAPSNGAPVFAGINGSTGVITQNVNAQGVAQFNTAVTAVGVDNTAHIIGGP